MLKIGKTSALIIALLLASIVSSVTAAVVYTLTRPATVTIISNADGNSTYLLKTYSDLNCINEVTSVDLGECYRGGMTDFIYLWVKNHGDVTVSLEFRSDVRYMDPPIGSVSFGIDESNTLAPNETRRFYFTFTANINATAGTYSFNIYIDAVA